MWNISIARSIFLLSILALPSAGSSQVERVDLRVDGLACPFCAYGLEKKLKDVPGVDAIETKVDDGRVILSGKTGESLAIEALRPAVERAGFTAREMTVTVVGMLLAVQDQRVIRVSGSDLELILDAGKEEPALNELETEMESPRRFRITGRLSERTPDEDSARPYLLTVEIVESVGSTTD